MSAKKNFCIEYFRLIFRAQVLRAQILEQAVKIWNLKNSLNSNNNWDQNIIQSEKSFHEEQNNSSIMTGTLKRKQKEAKC